jgi:hypothetical protein
MTDLSSKDITQFCKSLSSNNLEESKQLFLSLNPIIQKMFLYFAWEILSHKSKYTHNTYLTSFKIFKLFNGNKSSPNTSYNQYTNKPLFKTLYSNASLTLNKTSNTAKTTKTIKTSSPHKSSPPRKSRKSSPPRKIRKSSSLRKSRKTSSRRKSRKTSPPRSKKYEKEYQKYEEPENERDPLYIYYTTLRKQNPESKLAIQWLTEHGVYEDEERNELVEEYKQVVNTSK